MSGHKYTTEEREFLKSYIPGHTYKEIQAAFSEHFGWEISAGQVKGYMANHRINNGLNDHFPKGHIPHNKGMKGHCAPGCEKTWFPKGNMPAQHRPVGSEQIDKDGYVRVKVAEPNKWQLKHRYIWEQAHGPIPDKHIVIFRDGDRLNLDLGNLMLISMAENAVMNKTGLCRSAKELKDTAVILADVKIAASKAKKRARQR